MSGKKSGVKKSVAKSVYKNVNADLANLEKHMNNLVKDVEEMNKKYWYGSSTANKWYNTILTHYCGTGKAGSLVTFYTGVSNFQSNLKRVFDSASTKGITF